jgi:hypothetical protein
MATDTSSDRETDLLRETDTMARDWTKGISADVLETLEKRFKAESERGNDREGNRLQATVTYAVWYIDNPTTGDAHIAGIVTGQTALSMVGASTCPRRLEFERML